MKTLQIGQTEVEVRSFRQGEKIWREFRTADGGHAKWVVGQGWEKVKFEVGAAFKAALKEKYPKLFE